MREKAKSALMLFVICLVVAVAPQLNFIPSKDFAFLMSLLGILGSIISFIFAVAVIHDESDS